MLLKLYFTSNLSFRFYRFHPDRLKLNGGIMTETDRVTFTQEIAIFVTTFAGEIRDLRRAIGHIDNTMMNTSSHRDAVIAYLLDVSMLKSSFISWYHCVIWWLSNIFFLNRPIYLFKIQHIIASRNLYKSISTFTKTISEI